MATLVLTSLVILPAPVIRLCLPLAAPAPAAGPKQPARRGAPA